MMQLRYGVEPTRTRADTFTCVEVVGPVHPCEGVAARVPHATIRTQLSNVVRVTRAEDCTTAQVACTKD
jgi:hypothetical protein